MRLRQGIAAPVVAEAEHVAPAEDAGQIDRGVGLSGFGFHGLFASRSSPEGRPRKSSKARWARKKGITLGALLLLVPYPTRAATYAVGPTRQYHDLQAVARLLLPGDGVEVDGDATYPGGVILRASGAPGARISVKGVRVNGKRPVISGGTNTVEFRGSHYLFQGFEVTGGSARCLYHHGDDLTVIDTLVHDCARHGILGADEASGSLSLEYVEVYGCGEGDRAHQLYIATDETAHPGAVFRMQHSFIHDGRGGNNVKSRAERNELAYNWIEGALYHEVELIGPDGQDPKRAREDSDVVGNVIKKTRPGYAIRVGGDGTGETDGRYRFVNNTIVVGPETRAVFRLFNGLESIEMHNNAFYRQGGGGLRILYENEVRWAAGRPLIAGAKNWLPRGSTDVPATWQDTLFGDDPGFTSASDLRPQIHSPLIDAGEAVLPSPPGCAFPAPLAKPLSCPPPGQIEAVFAAAPRRSVGPIDIGAFEFGAAAPEEPPPLRAAPPAAPPAARPQAWSGRGGCGCRTGLVERAAAPAGGFLIGAVALLPFRRRTRRRS
jgi:hypothetical protein